METHQKDIEEKDPFGQNRADDGNDGNDDDEAEKSFLKALLAERALKNCVKISTYFDFVKTLLNESLNVNLLFHKSSNILLLFTYSVQHL